MGSLTAEPIRFWSKREDQMDLLAVAVIFESPVQYFIQILAEMFETVWGPFRCNRERGTHNNVVVHNLGEDGVHLFIDQEKGELL